MENQEQDPKTPIKLVITATAPNAPKKSNDGIRVGAAENTNDEQNHVQSEVTRQLFFIGE